MSNYNNNIMNKFEIINPNKNIFVFDVESIGLYGDAYAVGAIVIKPDLLPIETDDDVQRIIVDSFAIASENQVIKAYESNNTFIKKIIGRVMEFNTCKTLADLENEFMRFYGKHSASCDIYADCIYPVESNFLSSIARRFGSKYENSMPYPLKDICNFIDVDIDRFEYAEMSNLPKHDPYYDSMTSAFSLLKFAREFKNMQK